MSHNTSSTLVYSYNQILHQGLQATNVTTCLCTKELYAYQLCTYYGSSLAAGHESYGIHCHLCQGLQVKEVRAQSCVLRLMGSPV